MLKEPHPTLSAMPRCALLFGETVGGLGGFGRVPLFFFFFLSKTKAFSPHVRKQRGRVKREGSLFLTAVSFHVRQRSDHLREQEGREGMVTEWRPGRQT